MKGNLSENKRFKTKLVVAICFAVTMIFAAVIGASGISRKAYAEEWKGGEIKTAYSYGETIRIPEYTLTTDGKTLNAVAVVCFPDGTNYRGGEIKLDQAGRYAVKYTAVDNDKVYAKTFNFDVGYNGWNTSGDSETSYGSYTEYGADSIGLNVRLAKNDSLVFTKLIDVSDLVAANNIFEGFVTPDKRGVADFDKLIVRLTDAKDPSVYVDITLARWLINENGYGWTFVKAGGQGQTITGDKLEVLNGSGKRIFGTWTAQFNSNNGVNIIWGGKACDKEPDAWILSAAFDNFSAKVFAQGELVSQLTSPEYYKDLWMGFTSDKVRLSISAAGYHSNTANFCLTKVLGQNIKSNSFVDDGAPVITVHTSYDEMPEGKLGEEYKIPEATAYDDYSGEVKVSAKVYYNYTSANPVSVSVVDGKIIPEKRGYYAIVYTAKDHVGNESVKTYVMHAGGEIPELTISVPEISSEATLGYYIELASPEVSGGSGDKEIKITATFNGETTEVTGGFTPDKAGEWTVTYTVTDYVGNVAVKTIKINAAPGDRPIFNEKVNLQPVYISGSEYLLPVVYCDDYSSGKLEKKLCSVKVEYPNGNAERYTSGETFVPDTAKGGNSVKITYYYENDAYNNGTTEIDILNIRNGEEIDSKAYFYGKDFTASYPSSDTGVFISATKAAEKISWIFANAQIADGFSVEFTTIAGVTDFDAIKVTLRDSSDPTIAVTLSVFLGENATTVKCGDFETEIKESVLGGKRGLKIGYASGKISYGTVNLPVEKADGGIAFDGFPSGKVYCEFATENVKSGAMYKVNAVSGCVLSSDTGDYSKPTIKINGDYGGNYNYGDEYVLYPVTAGDTYSPNVTAIVTVYDGEGNIATDVNGMKLDKVDAGQKYTVKLNGYGVWNARYSIRKKNWTNVSRTFTAYINVMDTEAPVIEITSGYVREAKVGDVIVLPDFTVSDNITENDKLVIVKYVIDANGKVALLEGTSNSFKATKAGKYVMLITVSDEFGNTTTKSFTVTVR